MQYQGCNPLAKGREHTLPISRRSKTPEENTEDQFRLVALSADVGRALTAHDTQADMLRGCADAMVKHLDAAFARVWVLDEAENVLVLRTSAGQYTHLDGPHGRVPVGQFKIGLIAEERKPHLTNSVLDDPRVSDQEWARREGMVAFAGHPLIVSGRLVGVVALFARHPLPEATLLALASVADQIGVGIERLRIDAERQQFVSLAENSDEFVGLCDMAGVPFYVNPAGLRMVGLESIQRMRRTEVADYFFAEDQDFIRREFLPKVMQNGRGEVEIRFRHFGTGEAVWVLYNVFTLTDAEGRPTGLATVSRDISERKALEAERERLLAEARVHAEREALLNRIGQAIRATLDPEAIQETAAALLGAALGADRCYFSVYDPQVDAVRIARDWCRADLPSVAGEYGLSAYQGYVDALYAEGTANIADARDPVVAPDVRRVLSSFGIRAFLAVPLFNEGKFVAAIAASMNDGPRMWTPDEASLMEAVLTQTRTAAEAARVARRERNISQQLQDALQPELPGVVPGITLTRYYEPALAEAGVGGDFFDCFAVEKNCTALVVGDLSGKGLAAAAQVATVRNMLRAFLYSQPTVAEAVTDLNRVLAENNLLTGFTTLWVGAFDSGTRILTYVNCGQEPALVRRAATGLVEQLLPTGPILGSIENAHYIEARVTLMPGDALAIFTDGFTECGPSRAEMLGIEGVAALLGQPLAAGLAQDAIEVAEHLALRLISGVEEVSIGGPMRDDLCLLVGVVTG
jgi:PAS domain S-box-containing protein